MFKCDICSREFTTKNGLGLHSKKCIIVVEDVVEPIEEIVNDNDRTIQKLMDKARSTYDAKSRYDIECEIRRLRDGSR